MTKEIEELLKINETIITSEQCEEHRTLKNDERVLLMNNMKIKDYIQQLELNVEASRMEHENDLKMIDKVKGNAVKWSKERDNLKVILDKVTDKLKEVDKKYKNEYENIENMELSATKICVLQELTCVIEDIEEILNIIEGEKK